MYKLNEILWCLYCRDYDYWNYMVKKPIHVNELKMEEPNKYAIHTGVTFFTKRMVEMAILYVPLCNQLVKQLHQSGLSVPALNGLVVSRSNRKYYDTVENRYVHSIHLCGFNESLHRHDIYNSHEIPWLNEIDSFEVKNKDGLVTPFSRLEVVHDDGTVVKSYPLRKQMLSKGQQVIISTFKCA